MNDEIDDRMREGPALDVLLGEDGTLRATFVPREGEARPETAHIFDCIVERGYGAFFIFPGAVESFAARVARADGPIIMDIGERRNGSLKVSVANDRMAASVAVSPAYGGRKMDRIDVLEALAGAGVVFGLLDDVIDRAVARCSEAFERVAVGQHAERGKDTQFLSLVPEMTGGRPKVNEHGYVDYRELDLFVTVPPGVPLMRRVPATTGADGMNVLGEVITAVPGRDHPFAPRFSGAEIDPADPNVLCSAIGGQPVLIARGVTVNPTLTLKNVDFSTGNVKFEGSVRVLEDVAVGMKIKATGDVIVGGMVDAAEIEAGGDVTVARGVIGHGELGASIPPPAAPGGSARSGSAASSAPPVSRRPSYYSFSRPRSVTPPPRTPTPRPAGPASSRSSSSFPRVTEPPRNAAKIRAGGMITARFVEKAVLEAGTSIAILEAVKQSDVTAADQIVVGRDGAAKGHVVGGALRATECVKAVVLGSQGGVPTSIEVGVSPALKRQHADVEQQLLKLYASIDEIHREVAMVKAQPTGMSAAVERVVKLRIQRVHADIDRLEGERYELEGQLNRGMNARVVIGQRIYGDVILKIANATRAFQDETSGGIFRVDGDQVYLAVQ